MQTSPICRQGFFGRTELLSLIERRALELSSGYRQNLVLLGSERIGKTSILLKSAQIISNHPPLLPIYLEIRAKGTLTEFARQFSATLLYQYRAAIGQSAPESFAQLCDECRPFIPKTVSVLTEAIVKARRSPTKALELLFGAPGCLRQESGRQCVILLDEFHRLNAWEKTFSALGKQVMVQKETMYLLASSSVEEAKKILQERLALLFGHFEVVTVGPFDLPTSVAYLSEYASQGLGQETLIALGDLLQGHPYLLSALAPHLQSEKTVAAALARFMLDSESKITQEYEERIRQVPEIQREQILHVLMSIVHGNHRVLALPQATGLTPFAVTRALKWLTEAGWIVREGVFAYLPDRLFCFWLRSSYQIRYGLVQADHDTLERWFAQEVEKWLDRTVPKGPQNTLELLTQLFRNFQNDLVGIRGRRTRLPKLEVHTLLLPGLPRGCVGHREDGSWFCIPCTAYVSESDAIHLIQTLRHVSKPWKRRIVVAVQGLEVNAKLLLQEHKFWVWELEDLNHLLELHGLSRLIPTETALSSLTVLPSAPETIAAPGEQATA